MARSHHAKLESRGTDGWTHTGSTNSVTGATARLEQGTDTYTLSENGTASGGAFAQSVTGAESYTGRLGILKATDLYIGHSRH